MIESYEIKKINGDERLILYLNIDYEFSLKEFNDKRKKIENVIEEYLIKNKIAFKGHLVTLIVGGVLVGNLYLNDKALNKINNYNNKNQITYVTKGIRDGISSYPKLPSIVDNNKEEIKEEEKKEEKKEKTKEEKKVVQKVATTKQSSVKTSNKKTSVVSNNTKSETVKSTTNKVEEVKTETVNNNSNSPEKKEEPQKEVEVVDNNIYVNVIRNGREEKIELETYIIGVVSAEMPASFHEEALKSQAIIARTYALKARSKGKSLKANEANQSYKTVDELKSMWQGNFNTYYNKVKKAVNATKGMYLSYNGTYIEAVYHSTSNGKTEDSRNVWGNAYPYLISVDSPYDKDNRSFIKTQEITFSDLSKKLGLEITKDTNIEIISHTSSGRVLSIKVNDKEFKGVDFRNKLGLRSADFTFEIKEGSIVFTTKGYGHGVGLSQYGANGYAKSGMSYKNILSHYYPKTVLKTL